ncbi:unnamed protein product [Strongylus vulgaris]|uniref:Uncharacterized protein n=1 Tax=Strongylus vulgaris TaxID=40348 RepID=A0A3P7JKR9_STRVU|nr:unnamed protein product [Strongylus vulgaris]
MCGGGVGGDDAVDIGYRNFNNGEVCRLSGRRDICAVARVNAHATNCGRNLTIVRETLV